MRTPPNPTDQIVLNFKQFFSSILVKLYVWHPLLRGILYLPLQTLRMKVEGVSVIGNAHVPFVLAPRT